MTFTVRYCRLLGPGRFKQFFDLESDLKRRNVLYYLVNNVRKYSQ